MLERDRFPNEMGDLFRNRRLLVTGASSGIGRAVAVKLVNLGATVVGNGRDANRLEETRQSTRYPDRMLIVHGDLSSDTVRGEIFAKMPNVDAAVLCAGVLRHCAIVGSDVNDWRSIVDINLLTTMILAKEVAERMAVVGSGHVVLIGSTLAQSVRPTTSVYAATKAGISAFAQGLRVELEDSGIKVTEVSPGFTNSNIRRSVVDSDALRLISKAESSALDAEDVAEAVIDVLNKPMHVLIDQIVLRGIRCMAEGRRLNGN